MLPHHRRSFWTFCPWRRRFAVPLYITQVFTASCPFAWKTLLGSGFANLCSSGILWLYMSIVIYSLYTYFCIALPWTVQGLLLTPLRPARNAPAVPDSIACFQALWGYTSWIPACEMCNCSHHWDFFFCLWVRHNESGLWPHISLVRLALWYWV